MKGIIFDCDGTLFQIDGYIPTYNRIFQDVLTELTGQQVTLSPQECYEPLHIKMEESDTLLRGRWNVDPKAFWKRFFDLDLRERKKLINVAVKPFSDIHVLKDLAKYKIGMLSNTPRAIVMHHLRYFHLLHHFTSVVCGFYKSGLAKPETRGISLCLKKMGLQPHEAVMVGDAGVDIEVGKKIGMTTVLITRSHTSGVSYILGTDKPDYQIEHLSELKPILRDLGP